jgi:hypothetical protein
MAQLARRPAAGLTDAGEAEAFLAELEALLQVD